MRRRNHVHAVLFDRHRLRHLQHRHARRFLNDLVGDALVIGRQVQNDHERHATVLRHMLEKQLDRLQAARRGADAHHREIQVAGGQVLAFGRRGRGRGFRGHHFGLFLWRYKRIADVRGRR